MAGRAQPGRNLLRRAVAARVVARADVRSSDLVLDIGAGTGALTLELARRARRVIAVEMDPRRANTLRQRCSAFGNVEVHAVDAMRRRLPNETFRVVANPPFALTSTVLRELLDPRTQAQRLDVVLEEGFVRMMVSRHPGRELPLAAGPWWGFSYGMQIPATAFCPPPRVDAAVLIAIRREEALLPASARRMHEALIRRGLARAGLPLRAVLRDRVTDRAWSRFAADHGIPRDATARTLSPEGWAALTALVLPRTG